MRASEYEAALLKERAWFPDRSADIDAVLAEVTPRADAERAADDATRSSDPAVDVLVAAALDEGDDLQ